MNGPLASVRVLDLSRLLPGPACTWYLQGLGAAVDRVEVPGAGDFTRHVPPYVDGVGSYFAALSRGKRSLALDLRKPAAAGVIRRLLPHYDVLVEGFKPGVMEQMGLDPNALVADFKGLVVARISGYGQTGPWRDRPGHDVNYVGITGALSLGHADGSPLPVQVADLAGAMAAAMGIAAALFDAQRTGNGRVLDVSLAEAALSFVASQVTGFSTEGREPAPAGEVLTGGIPLYGTYRCADGKWLTVGALEPKFQAALASAAGSLGRPELEAVFLTRTRDTWVDLLADACTGEVLGMGEIAAHPHLAARGAVERLGGTTWVRPPFADAPVPGAIPGVGEHTEQVLTEAGFDPAERAALRAAGVFG